MSSSSDTEIILPREDANGEGKMLLPILSLINTELNYFKEQVSIQNYNNIPDPIKMPIERTTHWLKSADVICCFVDMEGSTKLSANLHDKTTAKAYRLFTETAVRIFHHFGASYIDIKGDGVFSLFNSSKIYSALAATIAFKTFVYDDFTPKVKELTGQDIGGSLWDRPENCIGPSPVVKVSSR
jgi:hypothetical protein